MSSINFSLPNKVHITIESTDEFYVLRKGHYIKLNSLSYGCEWSRVLHELKPVVMAYEQENEGVLAWVLEYVYEGDNNYFWFKIPVVQDGDTYTIREILSTSSLDMNLYLSKYSVI